MNDITFIAVNWIKHVLEIWNNIAELFFDERGFVMKTQNGSGPFQKKIEVISKKS